MDNDESVYRVRAVVFFDRGWWVAQCLEYNLCTAAKKREDLPRRFMKQLRGQAALDLHYGKRPFENFSRASEKYWKLYERGTPLEFVYKESWLYRLVVKIYRIPKVYAEVVLAPT